MNCLPEHHLFSRQVKAPEEFCFVTQLVRPAQDSQLEPSWVQAVLLPLSRVQLAPSWVQLKPSVPSWVQA